jgi:cyclopropane-fatty-acyl-phospholipid synthase
VSGERGGDAAAIRHHYDASNAFYALWLDPTMTYSCALWGEADDPDDLAGAQLRKLDHHLAAAGVARGKRLLDVGCGWGGLLDRALARGVQEAVGLTLSDAQLEHVEQRPDPRRRVLKESWTVHRPERPYDGIVSIGAFEHFASPGDSSAAKVELYREFFARCRSWLGEGGLMSLQTICYGTMQPHEAPAFIHEHIFPDSEIPGLAEIVAAADGLFEITLLRNDRLQYGQTCDLWLRNLRARRPEAAELVGEEKVAQYVKYLRMSSFAFRSGRIGLLRLSLAPVV